jgi:hypothetical protein
MPKSAKVISDTSSIDTTYEHLCVMLSEAAVVGVESLKSIRLMGQLQGKQMMILLDSGSSTSFISSELADDLIGVTTWEIQGLTFYSDFKVLPLLHFDVILGYDWLE